MNNLTPRQKDVLEAITVFFKKNNYAPSIRELCDMLGIASSSTIHNHLEQLRKKGVIDWEESKPRTMRLLVS